MPPASHVGTGGWPCTLPPPHSSSQHPGPRDSCTGGPGRGPPHLHRQTLPDPGATGIETRLPPRAAHVWVVPSVPPLPGSARDLGAALQWVEWRLHSSVYGDPMTVTLPAKGARQVPPRPSVTSVLLRTDPAMGPQAGTPTPPGTLTASFPSVPAPPLPPQIPASPHGVSCPGPARPGSQRGSFPDVLSVARCSAPAPSQANLEPGQTLRGAGLQDRGRAGRVVLFVARCAGEEVRTHLPASLLAFRGDREVSSPRGGQAGAT